MDPIEFTDNHEDLSDDKGFPFKFSCEQCGNESLSTYKVCKMGLVGGLLKAASSLFGGIFGRAVEEEERVEAKTKQVTVTCKKCGQGTGGAKFCPHCGARTGDVPQFCPSCKAKAAPGAKFCGECGTAL